MMPDTEPVHQHPSRGLDHGAWVPLKIMYPEADIPVLQMSLPTQDPYKLLTLGSRLRELRDEGVLVIGSGFLTHGLPFLTEFRIDATAPGWSVDFDLWAAEALARGDVAALAAYRSQAPGMPYAHPTVEHYTPLFVTLGAATDTEAPGRAALRRLLDGPVEAQPAGRLTGTSLGAPSRREVGGAMSQVQQHKFQLDESEMPTRWYNVLHDLPTPPPPVLHPGTGSPWARTTWHRCSRWT